MCIFSADFCQGYVRTWHQKAEYILVLAVQKEVCISKGSNGSYVHRSSFDKSGNSMHLNSLANAFENSARSHIVARILASLISSYGMSIVSLACEAVV